MAKYFLTKKAVEDLSRIWNYTYEVWSERQADKYYESLISACQNLAENPETGKPYEEIRKELYGFRINRHIIFYRVKKSDEIKVVRILHEQMDLKSRMRE